MIEIKNLTKIYKLSSGQMKKLKTKSSTKVAVDNISFKAEQGEILGLLGPNGAGKTTTLRCIATLLKPTDGTVIVDGHDTVKEPEAVRASIGFLTNEIKLNPFKLIRNRLFKSLYLFNNLLCLLCHISLKLIK